MLANFPPEADGDGPISPEKGSSQRLLLFVLLLLVAVFGYLYFFTGLIKPREEPPKAPPVQPSQVIKPLPPRLSQSGATPGPVVKPEGKLPTRSDAGKPAPPAVLPQGKPMAAPTPRPTVSPMQPAPEKAPKEKEKEAPQMPAKVASPPVAPAKAPNKGAAKPAAAAAHVKKTPAPATTVAKSVKTAAHQGAYTVHVGEFAATQNLKRLRAKLKKLGVAPVRQKKIDKPELMHRLFLATFDNRDAADAEMRKLQQKTSAAFILEENGKYAVYAGSYLIKKGAVAEQRRLARKGAKLTLKTAKVTIPIIQVTAGFFSSREDAQKVANRLKNQGVLARVSSEKWLRK